MAEIKDLQINNNVETNHIDVERSSVDIPSIESLNTHENTFVAPIQSSASEESVVETALDVEQKNEPKDFISGNIEDGSTWGGLINSKKLGAELPY